MPNIQLGELIREVRISRNLAQNELVNGICSRRQLIRLEKNEFEPSSHLIAMLSQKLCFNFSKYYQELKFSKSEKAYQLRIRLMESVFPFNSKEIQCICNEMEKLEEFKSGENLQYFLYGKALISTYFEKNYETSNSYCMQAIHIEDPKYEPCRREIKNYSPISLMLQECLGYNYMKERNYDESIRIFQFILLSICHCPVNSYPIYPEYSSIECRLYQYTAYNLSTIYYSVEKYYTSLLYANEGIDFSVKRDILHFLPRLMHQKFRTLCKVELYDMASSIYHSCAALYLLMEDSIHLRQLEQDYLKLFEHR